MRILIIIPSYNEEKIIQSNCMVLDQYLSSLGLDYSLCVADNNSQDRTAGIIAGMKERHPHLLYRFINKQGKGNAVLTPWTEMISDYDIFCFMDADLATDITAIPALIAAIADGADIAIGSRYMNGSRIRRGILRSIISHICHRVLRFRLDLPLSDFSCGFKAVTRRVVAEVVPLVENRAWFFDTELLYRAHHAGFRIKEIPVTWHEPRGKDNASRLSILDQTREYLREIKKLRNEK